MSEVAGSPFNDRSRASTRSEAVTCAENTEADVALLRAGAPGFRVAVLTDRAVSIGAAVRGSPPYLGRAREEGLAVVRRSTGGTGVLHGPGDIAWAVVLPRDHPVVGRDFVHAYPRLGAGVVRFLAEQGLAAAWTGPRGLSHDYCLLSARGHALTVDGRVLGGAAQHLAGSALLHHGVVPMGLERGLLSRVFDLPEAVVRDHLTSLSDLGLHSEPRALAESLARAIGRDLATATDRS